MKTTTLIMLILKAALATALLFLSTTILFGQEKQAVEKSDKYAQKAEKFKNKEFCGGDWNNGDKVSARDLREMTIPATGTLAVDGRQNGGIKVKGSERSDILVRACVQGWGATEEAAQALVHSVKISTGPTVIAEAASERDWSVSYEILVPRSTNLDLKAHNGGIGISSVEGNLQFETLNGGVSLWDVAGDVKGRTTNGGVMVALSGNSWRGSGLDVTTTNGGVHLSIPETFAANIETGTTNGGFHSNIPALNVTNEDLKGPDRRGRPIRLNTSINGGGAPIRLMTTNGGVNINSASDKSVY